MKRLAACMLCFVLMGSSIGCVYSREMVRDGRRLERAIPGADFDRKLTVSVGPVGIRLARWVTRRADRHDEDVRRASEYLRFIKRVRVGFYEPVRLPDLDRVSLGDLPEFDRRGWIAAVKVREADELVWILYREQGTVVTEVYAVVLSDDELVMAHVSGRLNGMLQDAIEDHGPLLDLAMGHDSPLFRNGERDPIG